MRIKIIVVFLLLCILLQTSQVEAQFEPSDRLIELVNQLRTSYGFLPYRVDFILTNVAQVHANWLAANDLNTHLGPEGLNPDQRAKKAGYGAGYDAFVIENIATGSRELRTPELVISIWEKNPEQLNAMISPNFEHIGMGYVEAYGKTWFVMMVGWVDDRGDGVGAVEELGGLGVDNIQGEESVVREISETGAVYHEVQPGQSAWYIASFYQMDIWDLLSLNNLPEDVVLQPGDILLIQPAPTEVPSITPSPLPATATPEVTPTGALASSIDPGELPEEGESLVLTETEQRRSFFEEPINQIGLAICLVLFVIFLYRLIPRRY